MRDNIEPTRDNGFFVNLQVDNHTWGNDWETNWTAGCSSFVLVTWNSGLPFTSATVIVNDPEEGWFIDGEYILQEHQVGEEFLKAHYYLDIEGVLSQWLARLGLPGGENHYVDFDQPNPTLVLKHTTMEMNGFEIYGVDKLLDLRLDDTNDGLFYILPDKIVCEKCAHTLDLTQAMFQNDDVSACWSHDPWDHQECDHCGVVFDAKERTYHPQPCYAGE